MAWDKNRPVAPFVVFKEGTIFYERGEREQMEQFTYCTLEQSDIDAIYQRGSLQYDELVGKSSFRSSEFTEFRAFKDVELNLTYETFGRGRSAITFWWRDDNGCRYPMFAAELDRLIKNGMISNRIGGLWSAEKRGQNYGIRLEKLLWRSASSDMD